MNQRNKIIQGKYVIVEEVQPKHFEKIIEWRNNPENNRYLNQPYELTMELQQKWYEKYLVDLTQGLFVFIDKSNNKPFGTLGFTDYDAKKKIMIEGRALVGESEYRGSKELTEGYLLVNDYLYEQYDINTMYIHVVNQNKKVISLNKKWGYKLNNGPVCFPEELLVNGLEQTEYLRDRNTYYKIRPKIEQILNFL